MMTIKRISEKGLDLLKDYEKLRLEAYDDNGNAAGGVWTIGWGTTRYPNGVRVKKGDTCTIEQANEWLRYAVLKCEQAVDDLTTDALTQSQFDALTDFVYNLGEGAYARSTLRRVVNSNPNSPMIRYELRKWHYDDGKPLLGLWRRRHAEGDLYFGVHTPCPEMP